MCQRLLTVGFRRAVAYLRFWRAEFDLRPSDRCFAPSAPRELYSRLRASAKSGCQRLLTFGKRVCDGILERLEGGVGLQRLAERLSTLRTDIVVPEAASKGQIVLSGATGSREKGVRWRT